MTAIPAEVAAELTWLQAENARLLRLLKLTPKQAAPPGPAQAAYFEAPPGPVHDGSPPDAKVAFFGALFAARTDVYRSGSTTRVPANMDGFRYPGYLPFPDAPISSAPHPDALGSPVRR